MIVVDQRISALVEIHHARLRSGLQLGTFSCYMKPLTMELAKGKQRQL